MDNINVEYNRILQESYNRSRGEAIRQIDIKKVRERAVKKEKERTKRILKIVVPVVIVTLTGGWLKDEIDHNRYTSEMLQASRSYEYIISDNTHRTNDNSSYWFDTSKIGNAISELPTDEKDLAVFSLVTKIKSSGGGMDNADQVVRISFDGQFEDFNDYAKRSFGVDTSSKDYYDEYEAALATVFNARQIQSGLNEEKTGGQR